MIKAHFTKIYDTPSCDVMSLNVELAILGISTGNPDPDVVDDSDNWG